MLSTDPLLDAGHLFTIKQNVFHLAPSFFPCRLALRSFIFLTLMRNLVKPVGMHAFMGSCHDWTFITLRCSSKRLYVVFLRTVTNKCFNLCRSQECLPYSHSTLKETGQGIQYEVLGKGIQYEVLGRDTRVGFCVATVCVAMVCVYPVKLGMVLNLQSCYDDL